ncbi:uncharacterized protein B0I36DRAFT_394103 [Microdochium trichocladiopsis]|uniref:Polycomb protein VEFS-Box domain-containing protein n=1 Tax=Microdochium trichocladiopsis TaxID=1682393 RepID=A0A9P9BKR8_9PEZI|nr:uncharacterized protein B0I36DRAFT_394103 [Microdochium trichocladiopsis]KAH7021539.1 hypothetical protein B0I36DRAFT_394103 [Microdochium trichocladiopsis]
MAATTPFKRDFPFLHRAWKTAVGHLSPYAPEGIFTTNGEHGVTGNGDDAGHRPAKRRRLSQSSADRGLGDLVGKILPDEPCHFEKALRIEVLKITQRGGPVLTPDSSTKDASAGSPVKKDKVTTSVRCRCKLIICRAPRPEELRILYCDSQICNVKVPSDADGGRRMARIYLTKPFHIPAEKIYVLREDDDLFTLEDSYFISVELESAGDPNWPPQALLAKEQRDDAKDAGKRWVLSAQTTYQFDKHRTTAPVKLRRKVGFEADAGLDLDIDLRWPTNHAGAPLRARPVESPSEVKAAASGALETLTSGQLNQSAETENIIRAGDGHEPPPDEDFDETGEAVTPTRALRQKKKQIYNLKALSDKARGKGLKERKQQVKATESGLEAGRVTWVLPQLGQVTTADFGCIRCYATHPSQALLLQHTEDHPEFKFRLDLSGKHGMRILISQHGQPTPEPEDAESEPAREMTPRKQPKPRVSHQKQQRLLPVKPKDPRQLIPDNKQPLYNRVTKATLAPGALIEPPPVDDSWLMQKHRDVILDYSDVHAEEKEYICEWDAFVLKQRITSEPHLQNVYLSFIEEKASWLTSRQSRMIEFAKHLTYLKARNSLTQETIIKAFAMLRDAKADAEEVSSEEPKPASPRVEGRRSASGCGVCGQPVRGPSTLICDNEDCDRPFYHEDCIRSEAKMPVSSRRWRCNGCHEDAMVVD